MRRLIAVAAALLIASQSWAGGLAVWTTGNPGLTSDGMRNELRFGDIALSTLNRFGADYTIMPRNKGGAPMEWLRTGKFYYSYGIWLPTPVLFDAALILDPLRSTSMAGPRWDSLTFGGSTRMNSIPILIAEGNGHAIDGAASAFILNAAESVGVASGGALAPASTFNAYLAGSPSSNWNGVAYGTGFTKTTTNNGVRPIVLGHSSNYIASNGYTGVACQFCDSLTYGANVDTMIVWDKLNGYGASGSTLNTTDINSNVLPVVPMTFAKVGGSGGIQDSAVATYPGNEIDPQILLLALAHLDSLSGQKLLGKKVQLPIKVALTIDAAFSRSSRRHYDGLYVDDSTGFKQTLDSLAAMNGGRSIPITVGCNIDSMGTYPSEWAWWQKLPNVRLTPWVRTGVGDTTANSGNTTWLNPVDIYGHFRKRAFYGDGSASGKDTSVFGILKSAFYHCDSAASVHGLKTSRFLLAPEDDYSPQSMTNGQGTGGSDSLAYCLAKAGATGLRSNFMDLNARAYYVKTAAGPNGWWYVPGYHNAFGQTLKVLGYPGHEISGGARQTWYEKNVVASPAWVDTNYANAVAFYYVVNHYLEKAISGIIAPNTVLPYDEYRYDQLCGTCVGVDRSINDYLFAGPGKGIPPCNIIKMGCNDLAGVPIGTQNTVTGRWGWWAIKSFNNYMNAVNKLAGRTIITWDYPENITP